MEFHSADSISFYKDSQQSWRMNQDFGFHAFPSLFVPDQKKRKENITFPRNWLIKLDSKEIYEPIMCDIRNFFKFHYHYYETRLEY